MLEFSFLNRRVFIKTLLISLFTKKAYLKNSLQDKITIVFGSCSNQNNSMNHWHQVVSYKPNLLILLGDNVYGDFKKRGCPLIPP